MRSLGLHPLTVPHSKVDETALSAPTLPRRSSPFYASLVLPPSVIPDPAEHVKPEKGTSRTSSEFCSIALGASEYLGRGDM